jgi:hypothetical protein
VLGSLVSGPATNGEQQASRLEAHSVFYAFAAVWLALLIVLLVAGYEWFIHRPV